MLGAVAVVREYGHLEDAALVARVRAGEVALFEVLMRRYNQRVFRVARAILRDAAMAEDALQNAYVRAYHKLDQFSGAASFGPWITRIVANEALGCRRHAARQAKLVERAAETEVIPLARAADSPEQLTSRQQLLHAIEVAIEKLPDGAREVLVLRDLEELSTAETAASLDINEAAVRVRLHRARQQLRGHLQREIDLTRCDLWAFAGERCDRVVSGVLARI